MNRKQYLEARTRNGREIWNLSVKEIKRYLEEHNPKILIKCGVYEYTSDLASLVYRIGSARHIKEVFNGYMNTYVNDVFWTREATGWTDGHEVADYDDTECIKIEQSYWLKQD